MTPIPHKENRSKESRNAVVIALGNIGPAAGRAVPFLLGAAVDSDFSIRLNALIALGEIHAQPELVVPVLVAALRNRDESRVAAEDALGDFGADAKAAVPSLVELLKDELPPRTFAAEALKRIDPEAAARAGVR